MKKLLLLSLLSFLPFVGMHAQSQNSMWGEDVEFDASDGTADMELYLSVDEAGRYFATHFTIVMPKGFTIVSEVEDGETFFDCYVNNSRQRDTSASLKYFESTNSYNVITQNASAYKINQKSGYYIIATIQADEDVVSGTYPVTLKNITMADGVVEVSMPDFTFNIIYTKAAKTYDLTVTDAGMATMYLDFPVTIPSDANNLPAVYYVAGIEGNTLTMYEVENTIPANTGVIVVGNQGTYTFTESTGTVAAITDNLLKGVTASTSVSSLGGTIYTLGRGKNGGLLGFHKYTGSTLGANKAYLTRNNGNVNAFDFQFPDGTTFINRLSVTGQKNEIYDLQGRKVENPTTGVYIINGVKTILK